jgi:hypothetical protein
MGRVSEERGELLEGQVLRMGAGILDGVGAGLGAGGDEQGEHGLVEAELTQLALVELGGALEGLHEEVMGAGEGAAGEPVEPGGGEAGAEDVGKSLRRP